MNAPAIAETKIRQKRQATPGAGVVRAARRAKSPPAQKFDLMAYAGIGKGLWGKTADDADRYIRELRS